MSLPRSIPDETPKECSLSSMTNAKEAQNLRGEIASSKWLVALLLLLNAQVSVHAQTVKQPLLGSCSPATLQVA